MPTTRIWSAISRQAIAAGYDVRVAEASRLPTLSAVGKRRPMSTNSAADIAGSSRAPARRPRSGSSARVPIFQGGLPAARIRQAQAQQGQVLRAGRRHRARRRPGRARRLRRLTTRRRRRSRPRPSRSRPTSSRSRATAPSRASARAPIIEVLNAEQELLQLAGRAGHRQARRLCRRLPAAERDGPGRGAGSRARRRTALRSARQLPPRREQLERLGDAIRRHIAGRDAHRQPGGDAANPIVTPRSIRRASTPPPAIPGRARRLTEPARLTSGGVTSASPRAMKL